MRGSVLIRSMEESDLDTVAELHIATWRVAYEGLVRQQRIDTLSVDIARDVWRKRFVAVRTNHLVCEWAGELAGFASCGPAREDRGEPVEPDVAELYALYVHPDRWGRGCGRALVEAIVERLRGEWRELILWTLVENAAARAFYERVGFLEVPDSARPRVDLGADVLLYRLPLM